MKSLTLFNQPIRVGEDGMICLTDMWKASGKSDAESPYHYLRNKQTKEFLAELEKNHESVVLCPECNFAFWIFLSSDCVFLVITPPHTATSFAP